MCIQESVNASQTKETINKMVQGKLKKTTDIKIIEKKKPNTYVHYKIALTI